MKKFNNWNLSYFGTGECQVVEERLDDIEASGISICPNRNSRYRVLHQISPDSIRAVVLGQDPYPSIEDANGIAFSVPERDEGRPLPGSLRNIFKEYQDDLGYPAPKNGDLTKWIKQGVLLWNAFPSCTAGKPGSHHWDEYRILTDEILRIIDEQNHSVFILLGAVARSFNRNIVRLPIIETSHPSPLGANKGFLGSKIFSRTNEELIKLGVTPIDWRLPDGKQKKEKEYVRREDLSV